MHFIRFSQVILGGWLMHCFKAVPPNHSRSQCDGRCISMRFYAYFAIINRSNRPDCKPQIRNFYVIAKKEKERTEYE
jgi:hypothetical protein